jgi:hypothetical protein
VEFIKQYGVEMHRSYLGVGFNQEYSWSLAAAFHYMVPSNSGRQRKDYLWKTHHPKVIDFVVPRMLKAVDYLVSRDNDSDGLLEQNHNEDWMATGLRAGKIVYSQACWIIALNNLSYLLSELGKHDEAQKMMKLACRAINAVEQKCGLKMTAAI